MLNRVPAKELLEQRSLQLVPLEIIDRKRQQSSVLLFQPLGDFSRPLPFASLPKDRHQDLCDSWLKLAASEGPSLAVAPEYCIPLDALERMLAAGRFPRAGAVMIVGLEECTSNELDALQARLAEYEFFPRYYPTKKDQFLDVAAILFWATNKGNPRPCVVFQSKTTPMSPAQNPREQQKLRQGTDVIEFSNANASARLITLICSDSLAFDAELRPQLDAEEASYLVVHLQLNSDPSHFDFAKYRSAFNRADRDWACIAVNWSRQTRVGHETLLRGKSVIVASNVRESAAAATFNDNHRKGVYYIFDAERRLSFFVLDYDQSTVLLDVHNLDPIGAPQNRQRIGVVANNYYRWEIETASWQQASSDGDFQTFLTNHHDADLLQALVPDYLQIEKFVSLCNGEFLMENPFALNSVATIRSDRREHINRTSFCQEKEAEARTAQRLTHVGLLAERVAKGPRPWWMAHDLVYEVRPWVESKEVGMTVWPVQGGLPGTGCYIGPSSTSAAVERLLKLQQALSGSMSRRVAVWYETEAGHQLAQGELRQPFDEDPNSKALDFDAI